MKTMFIMVKLKSTLILMIATTLLFGCNKSIEKLSVDERLQQYKKVQGDTPEKILASANKIAKNSKYF